jgi:RNA polymerase sigma factor (sigma-70 family)
MGDVLMNKLTLTDYIVEYQNGNEEVLVKLIGLRETVEKNYNKEHDTVYRLRFADKALHNIYLDILQKHYYIDGKDIDSYFLAAFTQLLDKVDVSKEPQQIIKWFRQRLNGLVQNEIDSEQKKYHGNLTHDPAPIEDEYSEDDEQINHSRLDQAVVEQYKLINDSSGYKEFIDFVGGVEKILSESQRKVYKLLQHDDMTQEGIAKELNCSQENVSQHITAMNNRIKKEYLTYRTYKALATKPHTYHKITSFIETYNQIIKYDVTDSFDYYGYVLDFVKGEVAKNHSTIDMDFYKSEQDIYGYFSRNKESHIDSVVDVIIDRCNKPTFNVIQSIWTNKEPRIKDFAKDKFVMDVIRVFQQYIKDIKKVISNASSHLVVNGMDNQNKIFDKVS